MWARKQLKRKEFTLGSEDQVDVWMGPNADDAEFDCKAVERLSSDEKLGSYGYAPVEKTLRQYARPEAREVGAARHLVGHCRRCQGKDETR